ncbi:hypothetical protein FVE85_5760 [Porphyridium purpureum]|uniref:Uncharacterized protein n=1 Tax=Porphyridium purpureum TaxID=35688 RepID=A0A5J4Z4B9_PORPP|nr:hypothetical protein FVE85_5760 [Porphyridium purpureum]|eukprot:POR0975..scf295_1
MRKDSRPRTRRTETEEPHTPYAAAPYRLYDRKADRAPVSTWHGEDFPAEAMSRLQVGDAVRLLLMDDAGCWEKIYFEITSIDYYSKGGSSKPRKFRGRALSTYRIVSPDRYVSEGDEIAFQRRHIVEVPGWHLDSFGLAAGAGGPQSNLAAVEDERRRILDQERTTVYFAKHAR